MSTRTRNGRRLAAARHRIEKHKRRKYARLRDRRARGGP